MEAAQPPVGSRKRRWFFYECRDPSGRLKFASIYLEGSGSATEFVEKFYYRSKKKDGVGVLCSITEKIGEQVI